MAPKTDPGPDALYRVFLSNGRPAYLPAPGSKGLPLEEAERLSEGLRAETSIVKVWEREED